MIISRRNKTKELGEIKTLWFFLTETFQSAMFQCWRHSKQCTMYNVHFTTLSCVLIFNVLNV